MWQTWQNLAKHRYLTAAFVSIFLVSFFASLFFASGTMDMATGSVGCPFMLHEETLCSMGTLDHVSAWESAFAGVMPAIVLLLVAVALAQVLWRVLPQFLRRHTERTSAPSYILRERTYTFVLRPLQEMFSSGILHPKLF